MFTEDLIVKRVSKKVRERTRENMNFYNMSLYDAFEDAAHTYARDGSKLWRAWYHSDFREYIPSAYRKEYLDFRKHPLKYAKRQRRVLPGQATE